LGYKVPGDIYAGGVAAAPAGPLEGARKTRCP
jgi:hypothetical protein